jgi:hypothetical protein
MRAVFHSEARLELVEAARWYNSLSPRLGSSSTAAPFFVAEPG